MSEPAVTPELNDFLREQEADDNTWWTLGSGHHLNLFEAALERSDELQAFVEWLIRLDEPGNKERQAITLTKIIENARTALEASGVNR